MNRFLFVALTLSLLAANPAAYADGRHGNDGRGHAPPTWHDHRPAYHPVPYRPPYAYPYPQHKNNDNHSEWPAYVVGGLVLGALLTNAFSTATAAPAAPVAVASGAHLMRDVDGNCYEIRTDAYGTEMRTQLPASACNW